MNKKIIIAIAVILLVVASLYVLDMKKNIFGPKTEEEIVKEVVLEFGERLRKVSLLAPAGEVVESIEKNYGPLISEGLMDAWRKEPLKAPGRTTSSPWPDRIDVMIVEKEEDGAYSVAGKVIEVTNSGDAVMDYSVALKLRNQDGRWVITGFAKAILQ